MTEAEDDESAALPIASPATYVVTHESSARRDFSSLKKAVQAIYIRPLNGSITSIMHRCYNVLICNAMGQGKDLEIYTIVLSELGTAVEFGSNNREHLKTALRRLNAIQVEWNAVSRSGTTVADEDSRSVEWGISTMLAGVRIRDGVMDYSFSPQIKDKLLTPAVYAKLDLALQNKFTSRHGLALYEICARYRTNPSRLSNRMSWTEWRDNICGESAKLGCYSQWKYFKRDVLTRAINEVNALSEDFTVILHVYKSGGTVDELQFEVQPKAQGSLSFSSTTAITPDEVLVTRMTAIGLDRNQAVSICVTYDEDEILGALRYTEERIKNKPGSPVVSPQAYFQTVLTQGYATAKSHRPTRTPQPQRLPSNKESKLPSYHDQVKPIKRYFQSLDDVEQATILDEFAAHLADTDPFATAEYGVKGLRSAAVAGLFFAWLSTKVDVNSLP